MIVQACLFGFVIGWIVYHYLRSRTYNMPPGPLRLPFIGNALQLGADQRYHYKFYEWSKIYGPVITVGFGPIKLVVVNNLETAMEVLVKKSKDFAGRQAMPSVCCWTDGFKDIAFTQYGPTWKLHRKIATQALKHYMQGDALQDRIHTALQTTFDVLNKQTASFSPEDILNHLITSIIIGLCFRGKFEYGDTDIQHILDKDDERTREFNNFIPEDMFPPLQYVYKSQTMKKMEHLYNELITDFIGKKFREEKQTFNRETSRHFTDSLLLAREEAKEAGDVTVEVLTDSHLIQTLSDIFFAGINTSKLTLYFAILHMVAFPDIQKKVQEELDREIGLDRLPGLTDCSRLSYTEAVLLESMRLSTVVPGGLLHSTMCDTDINGYKIPKDTLVMVNVWAIHHEPEAWDEPQKFKPERFLDKDGGIRQKPSNWIAFSAGKRSCLGEFVARPQLHLLFAGLMQQFSWRTEPGIHVDIIPQGNVFLAYPKPFNVQVLRRSSTQK